tara:strand:- start:182 stop:478 length:297 start_codon:yes stop_codon:yes gene_type:complete
MKSLLFLINIFSLCVIGYGGIQYFWGRLEQFEFFLVTGFWSVVLIITISMYSKKNWNDDFIYILLKRIGFSLGILKRRTEEKVNKAKDKMREDMGEWH